MHYIAFCTKGLEEIVREEIHEIFPDAEIIEISYKKVIFNTQKPLSNPHKLRTVDDIGILINKLELTSSNNSLQEITDFIDKQNLLKYLKFLQTFRKVIPKNFSLTLSSAGKRPYSINNLRNSLSQTIINKHKWEYIEKKHDNFDLRIFIEPKAIHLSVRLTKKSIYKRKYKILSMPGSLKPTVAAAMVKLVTKRNRNLKVVDNCCGSGTILCEAFIQVHEIFGGDIEEDCTYMTRKNLANLRFKNMNNIKQQDCTKTNWSSNYFDCALTNLPFGHQVKVARISDLYKNCIEEYVRIVKPQGKMCFLTTKHQILVKYLKKLVPDAEIKEIELSLNGQRPKLILANLS